MSRRPLWLSLVALSLLGCALLVYAHVRRRFSAETVLRLVIGSDTYPVDAVVQEGLPMRAYHHASVTVDDNGNFHLIASRYASASGQWNANPLRLRALSVLVADPHGVVKRTTALRRSNRLPVRHACYFLSASSSGESLWTARRDQDTEAELLAGIKAASRLTAYTRTGQIIQEWLLPTDIDEFSFVQAVGNSQVYVVDGERNRLWVYTRGRPSPEPALIPQGWRPYPGSSLITSSGEFWVLKAQQNGVVQALVAKRGQPARVFATFAWHRKNLTPFLSLADTEGGLFGFEYIRDATGKRPGDGAKAVYRITSDGTVRKLFETPDVLPTKRGYTVRAGQLLKADAHHVWMEVEYLKNNRVAEYQIVKIAYN